MLKCQELDKFDFKFIKKMKPDTVYKLKGKAAIAYIDAENYKWIAYSTNKETVFTGYDHYSNLFSCLYARYYNHCRIVNEDDLRYFNSQSLADDATSVDDIIQKLEPQVQRLFPKNIELGVELELEPEDYSDLCYNEDSGELERSINEIDKTKLVEAIKSDCSVYGGSELNLKHLPYDKWKGSGVKQLLKKLRDTLGLDNRYGTAGMHIHISGPMALTVVRQFETQRQEIGKFLNLIGFRRENIEVPGCDTGRDEDGCRYYRYGTGTDTIKNQILTHGTAEFRCFEVTTDYDLFMLRLKFVRELYSYLGTGRKIKDFAKTANKRARELFMKLYNDSRNPHAFGVLNDEELKLMEA